MSGDPLVFSFRVDEYSETCGLPFCAQGKQPCFEIQHFLPEQVKPFLSQEQIEEFFEKLNKIFHETGCPAMPIFFAPFILFIVFMALQIPIFHSVQGFSPAMAMMFIPFFLAFGITGLIMWMTSRRKSRIAEAIKTWNKDIGTPRGLYFILGDSQGDSNQNFWLSIYPSRIMLRHNQHMTVTNTGYMHLYVNSQARTEWCNKTGERFVMP